MINPEEIVDPEVDEQSVMTYLSQFPKSKLRPGAPLKPKGVQLYPKKAKSYGPGGYHWDRDHTLPQWWVESSTDLVDKDIFTCDSCEVVLPTVVECTWG